MLPALAIRGPNTPAPLLAAEGRESPKPNVRVHGEFGGLREFVETFGIDGGYGWGGISSADVDFPFSFTLARVPLYMDDGRDSSIEDRAGVEKPDWKPDAGS
ncbi:hypothetical protein NUW54_g14401 [Trametes sanguinea]|uniref:Uncharacterized protein n=1 Tax=Trametes sanguinea TaxID=158606 RepID=A0ACC1MCT6_9APHY|nr:hypothetical protein NUW54_g14401 [Trametes sanguinea]